MELFLTSSPFPLDGPGLNNANGFVDQLRLALPFPCSALFICSDPDGYSRTDYYAEDFRQRLMDSGFSVSSYAVLDHRNDADAAAWIKASDLLILAGGHVPTQNAYFHEIGLRELLNNYIGTVIGISAGSMNSADPVYAHVEEPGEAVDPHYQRFLSGLGLTGTMLLPHYQALRNNTLDGLRVMEDIAYPDSMGRCFIAVPDGSYLHIKDGEEILYGESWCIRNGTLCKLSEDGTALPLPLQP